MSHPSSRDASVKLKQLFFNRAKVIARFGNAKLIMTRDGKDRSAFFCTSPPTHSENL